MTANQDDAALARALAAEHATIYGYGLVAAFVDDGAAGAVADALAAHRRRREQVAVELGAAAPLAEAGYRVPLKVVDPVTALQLAVRLEEGSARAWRAVLEGSEPGELRTVAVRALTEDAVRARRWRAGLGATPATTAFPGRPER